MSDAKVNSIVNEIMNKGTIYSPELDELRNLRSIKYGLVKYMKSKKIKGSHEWTGEYGSNYYGIPLSLKRNELKTYVKDWYDQERKILSKHKHANIAKKLHNLGLTQFVNYDTYYDIYGLKLGVFDPRVYIGETSNANTNTFFVVKNGSLHKVSNTGLVSVNNSSNKKYKSIESSPREIRRNINMPQHKYGKLLTAENVVKKELARAEANNIKNKRQRRERFYNTYNPFGGYLGRRYRYNDNRKLFEQ